MSQAVERSIRIPELLSEGPQHPAARRTVPGGTGTVRTAFAVPAVKARTDLVPHTLLPAIGHTAPAVSRTLGWTQ
ncbi:hypothetical protein ACFY7Z_14990 [Streptomyces sp. NPDC012623]|uniref:hypothetical protein n=1 Tax=unclassified Streptomyces TaxID=2593676 RepID=UPI00369E98BD